MNNEEREIINKTKELIDQLSFIYDIDTLKMVEILRTVINERGTFDKEELRKNTRKYYQYNNNGKLPTLVYRTQPEYLKSPSGDTSALAQITYMFENTTPYDFLKIKYKGSNPTSRDLRLLETLLVDLNLQPAVVNVLIDYVLKKNNNKLNQSFVETIAGQWKRCNVETAAEAMELAKKENTKYNKKISQTSKSKTSTQDEPVWFNQEIKKEEIISLKQSLEISRQTIQTREIQLEESTQAQTTNETEHKRQVEELINKKLEIEQHLKECEQELSINKQENENQNQNEDFSISI